MACTYKSTCANEETTVKPRDTLLTALAHLPVRICRARGSGSAVAWRDSRGRRKQAEWHWGTHRVSSWTPGETAGSSAAVTAEAEARSESAGTAGDVR